ncbi:DNA repair protein RecN [Microlunatus phosphovorus NM-1]|uniref:DNA repair protein RecN n=1 Tax=Microlunatus phosphovorus (strain ATCC 700054 / DSM 10555 / JCM 9379 / NBRC 101784 / NCIMB 13414 / VKM Ac-1990 / NM-1) TaxID=1032480 RepID=F5XS76_MICPN|nr:DNA repair protein RecN [Microlunatus phosphovorus NM-1]
MGPRSGLAAVITELRISDLGVISDAVLALHPGLTVVTGETGAGKTMIVTSIDLLLGGRADPKAVRTGARRAVVEGRFSEISADTVRRVEEAGGELDAAAEADGEVDAELLVARQVTPGGRTRAFVGGAQVPIGRIEDLVGDLVTVHGQSEQVRLAGRDRQRELLDRFAGVDQQVRLTTYRTCYDELRAAQTELDRLRTEAQERAREIDLLRFGLDEIERAAPQPGEDVALAEEAQRLQASDDLRADAATAIVALAGSDDEAGGALAGLAQARRAVERLAAADTEAKPFAGRVREVGYLLTELAGDLSSYLAGLEVQPGRLEQIAERRFELAGLLRKYGSSCDEVLAWSARAAERLAALELADDRIGELTERITVVQGRIEELAGQLHSARVAAAGEFVERVRGELAALAMPHARLQFELTPVDLGPTGADQVDLLFSANPGSAPRSLGKVASGGEMSRVRLAVEVVLADGGGSVTFVFDEVDAGVGGAVAVEIGRRLALLARHRQVIVVTHLAQVAAFADRHFAVVKSDDGQVTTSGVREVAERDRVVELARMMAGIETTESALAHAGELLELASR